MTTVQKLINMYPIVRKVTRDNWFKTVQETMEDPEFFNQARAKHLNNELFRCSRSQNAFYIRVPRPLTVNEVWDQMTHYLKNLGIGISSIDTEDDSIYVCIPSDDILSVASYERKATKTSCHRWLDDVKKEFQATNFIQSILCGTCRGKLVSSRYKNGNMIWINVPYYFNLSLSDYCHEIITEFLLAEEFTKKMIHSECEFLTVNFPKGFLESQTPTPRSILESNL